jgi:hypothetical protein
MWMMVRLPLLPLLPLLLYYPTTRTTRTAPTTRSTLLPLLPHYLTTPNTRTDSVSVFSLFYVPTLFWRFLTVARKYFSLFDLVVDWECVSRHLRVFVRL